MSNALDRCVACGIPRRTLAEHDDLARDHAFVASAPQPEPSGDEAKVRELARAEAESIATRWVPAHMTARQGMVDDIAASLVRYRALGADAGKADGAREEREACVALAQESQRLQAIRRHKSKLAMRAIGDLRDAIARRGGEGK